MQQRDGFADRVVRADRDEVGDSLPACLRASTSATVTFSVRSMKPYCVIHASL